MGSMIARVNWTEIGVTGVLLVMVAVLAYYIVSGKFKEITKTFEAMDKKIDKIDERFDVIKITIDKIDTKLGELENTVSYIKGAWDASARNFSFGTKDVISAESKVVQSSSPLTLTEKGLTIAQQLNASKLVDAYVNCIVVSADAGKMTIQNTCLEFAHNDFLRRVSREELNHIEAAIFEEGGNSNEVLPILAILFRDKIFENRDIEVPVISSED